MPTKRHRPGEWSSGVYCQSNQHERGVECAYLLTIAYLTYFFFLFSLLISSPLIFSPLDIHAHCRLKQELQEEAIRLEAQRQAAAAAAAAEAKEKEKELRIAAETEENAGADTYRTNVNVNEGAEAEQRTTMGSPHLHLNTVIQVQAQARSRSGSISSVTGGTGAGGTRKKEATGTAKKARSTTPLTFALPEGAMRSDFRDIVDDLHARANFFAKTAPMPNAAVRILFSDAQGCFHLCIGSKVYVAGDLVTVFSVLSQETFSGVITAVSDDEVSIRCGSGLCIAVYLRQLLEGRVVISKDEDSYTMHNIMQASAEMAKRRNLNQEQVVEVDV